MSCICTPIWLSPFLIAQILCLCNIIQKIGNIDMKNLLVNDSISKISFFSGMYDSHWWKVALFRMIMKLIHAAWALTQLSIKVIITVHPILLATPYIQSITRGFTTIIELAEILLLSPEEMQKKKVKVVTALLSNLMMATSIAMIFVAPPIGSLCFAGAAFVTMIREGINLKRVSDSGTMSEEYYAARKMYLRSLISCGGASLGCVLALAGAGFIALSPPGVTAIGLTIMFCLSLAVASGVYNLGCRFKNWVQKDNKPEIAIDNSNKPSADNEFGMSSTSKMGFNLDKNNDNAHEDDQVKKYKFHYKPQPDDDLILRNNFKF